MRSVNHLSSGCTRKRCQLGQGKTSIVARVLRGQSAHRRLTDIEGECFDREAQSNAAVFHGDRILRLNRYETTLDRQFYKAMHELQRLQAARRGEHVPAPEAVDVTISTTENKGDGGAEYLASFGKNAGAEIRPVHGYGNYAEHQ